MLEFIAVFDNCVTDDLILKRYRCGSVEEAYELALKDSFSTGLSVGNFDLFIDVCCLESMGRGGEPAQASQGSPLADPCDAKQMSPVRL